MTNVEYSKLIDGLTEKWIEEFGKLPPRCVVIGRIRYRKEYKKFKEFEKGLDLAKEVIDKVFLEGTES